MNNPKADTQLNQALNATPEERNKSLELNVGFDEATQQWDLIIKHSGNADELRPYVVGITELLNGYAVVRIEQNRIEAFTRLPQIQYVEKPKRLFFASYQTQAVSCINAVKEAPYNLSGKGVLVACVDSGIDYQHMDFRNADGSTRLVALWDQTLSESDIPNRTVQTDVTEPKPPEGYFLGIEFTKEQLDAILLSEDAQSVSLRPSLDFSGHGTAVMGIAAGNGRESSGIYEGVAPQSDLLVVKIAAPLPNSFPRTTELIQAIDYCVRKAMERNQPMALNISFGSSYGSREGNSLLEAYLNQVADLGRMSICVGMGNEGRSAGHTSIMLQPDLSFGNRTNLRERPDAMQTGSLRNETEVEFAVGRYQTAFNLQIWKNYVDEIELELESPSGERVLLRSSEGQQPNPVSGTNVMRQNNPVSGTNVTQQNNPVLQTNVTQAMNRVFSGSISRYVIGGVNLLFYHGVPSPYQTAQELYLDFIPQKDYVEEGRWVFRVSGRRVVDGLLDFYLPGGSVLNEDTRFLIPSPERTLTIPSAAAGVISVGAYDSRLNSYANFSGRGYTREIIQVKPDLVAPGVRIRTTKAGGGYEEFTGTSFAAPFVTGAAALMMELGIVQGYDPYLYGEKVKAYLRRGARQMQGYEEWPNNRLGYGALCLRNSIPLFQK